VLGKVLQNVAWRCSAWPGNALRGRAMLGMVMQGIAWKCKARILFSNGDYFMPTYNVQVQQCAIEMQKVVSARTHWIVVVASQGGYQMCMKAVDAYYQNRGPGEISIFMFEQPSDVSIGIAYVALHKKYMSLEQAADLWVASEDRRRSWLTASSDVFAHQDTPRKAFELMVRLVRFGDYNPQVN
jgi:hypothetical protein